MADILRFSDHTASRSERPVKQDFLQDDDILNFDADAASGSAGLSPLKGCGPARPKDLFSSDWSNQELATLFRVKRLLAAAGVQVETDRGVTDEGDPWFVFCDTKGEVFIHLCRIRSTYLLDSPNITSPLSGRDFNELIEAFTRQKLLNRDDQPDLATHRVVRMRKDGNVFMHPSTMLAALVWTVFLASEEIVMLIPEDAENAERLADEMAGTSSAEYLVDGPQAEGGLSETILDTGALVAADLESSDDTKFAQNSYAISLTIIAVSLGFMSETLLSQDDISAFTDLFTNMGNTSEGEESSLATASVSNDKIDFFAGLGELFEHINPVDDTTETASHDQDGADAAKSAEAETAQAGAELFNTAFQTADVFFENVVDQVSDSFMSSSLGELANMGLEGIVSQLAGIATEPSTSNVNLDDVTLTYVTQIDDAQYLVKDLQAYVVDDMSVKATFDISSVDLKKTINLVDTSHEGQSGSDALDEGGSNTLVDTDFELDTAQLGQDAEAMEYIEYAFSKDLDIELIALDEELIFVDAAVLGKDSVDTVTFSWKMSNGDTVSLIGLQSDFEALDMIA